MTSPEMEKEFKIVYESISSGNAPGYTSKEISILLTQSQEEIAIEISQQGMDSGDYARTVLEKLLTTYSSPTITANTTLFPSNAYRVTLPVTFFHPFIEFAITEGTTTNRVCKPVTLSSYYIDINNPFAKPHKDLFWRIYENGFLTIITDGSVLTNLKGLYVAKPTPIITANITGTIDGLSTTTQPILNSIVHREIVNRAAKKAFAAMKDQTGYQLKNLEQNSN